MVEYGCCLLHSDIRKEVNALNFFITFLLSVMASVAGYYICKWLDGKDRDN